MSAKKIIFITGTDTGVGKTLLTALLLHHLRQSGCRALAMKPFCSGGRADVRLLQSLQRGEISDAEMNPFYFTQPVAPLVALKKNHRNITLSEVLKHIQHLKKKCDCLIIEGSGGLMVPLGKGYTVADLISKLNCPTIVAARNRLGTINHTLLTINALQASGVSSKKLAVTLMSVAKPDASTSTNRHIIAECLSPVSVMSIPFLGKRATRSAAVKTAHQKVKNVLEKLLTAIN